MRVKCVLCDEISTLEDENPLAKKIKNRPIHTFMCPKCSARINEKANLRIAKGNHRIVPYRSERAGWPC
ncbi:MAG: YlaI family protein [Bacilli bacterium]